MSKKSRRPRFTVRWSVGFAATPRHGNLLRRPDKGWESLYGKCRELYKYRKDQLHIVYWLDNVNCPIRVIRIDYRGDGL